MYSAADPALAPETSRKSKEEEDKQIAVRHLYGKTA